MAKLPVSRAADYDRVCSRCEFFQARKQSHEHVCTRARDLVTGAVRPTACAIARSAHGHCGPQGKNFVASKKPVLEAAE